MGGKRTFTNTVKQTAKKLGEQYLIKERNMIGKDMVKEDGDLESALNKRWKRLTRNKHVLRNSTKKLRNTINDLNRFNIRSSATNRPVDFSIIRKKGRTKKKGRRKKHNKKQTYKRKKTKKRYTKKRSYRRHNKTKK